MRIIDWIWHVRGSIALPLLHSGKDVFGRLEGIFQERGTTTECTDDALVFHKDNPDSQDRLASFETGRLYLTDGDAPALHYDLTSRPLLWCFIAPLPFLAVGFGVPSLKIAGFSFSGIFLVLYIAGRWIEQRQAHKLFAKAVGDQSDSQMTGACVEDMGVSA